MLYLAAIVLAFFLSFVLITKRDKSQADYILVAWLGVTGFQLLAFYLMVTQRFTEYPNVVVLGLPLPLAQGPFLYLYTCQQTTSFKFNPWKLLHFIPPLIFYLLFLRFFILPIEQKIDIINHQGRGFESLMMYQRYAILVSGVTYIVLSLLRLIKYRMNLVHQFSNTDKINFNWLFYLILWMSAIWIAVIFAHTDKVVFGFAALMVLWLGYFGIKQVRVFSQNVPPLWIPQPPALLPWKGETASDIKPDMRDPDLIEPEGEPGSLKYQRSTLSEKDAEMIYDRLKQMILEQKPFRNPDLTLNELARNLDVHPNHLSQVINSMEKKNFFDLINEKRVEEFIRLNSAQDNQKYTLLALAFDCGFNSKASFNRNFKKYTGHTPSGYLKKHLVY